METGGFKVGTRAGTHGPVIVVEGELDLGSAKAFQDCVRAVIADHPGAVEIDLAAVTFLDSSGIRALLTAVQTATEASRGFHVTEASSRAEETLRLAGLLEAFMW